MSIRSMSKSDIMLQLSNYNTHLSKKGDEYIPLNELKLLSKSDLIKIYEYRSSRPELYKSNPRDEPSEHASKELERQRKVGEDIEKERKKPRGLALFENPRISKSTGFFKIGDKVLADWVHDRRRRGTIIGIDPAGKFVIKIGDEVHHFYAEDLNFPKGYYVETAGIRPEYKAVAFKIKKMIEKKFGIYAEVVDENGEEVLEFED